MGSSISKVAKTADEEAAARRVWYLYLDCGHKPRQIVEMVGIPYDAVRDILSGKRGSPSCGPSSHGHKSRCPYCGAKVQLPCLACELQGLDKQD